MRIATYKTSPITAVAALFFTAALGTALAYKIVHIPLQLEIVLLFTVISIYPILRQPAVGLYLLFIIMPFIPFLRKLYYLLHQRPTIDPLIAVGDILTVLTLTALFFVFKEQRNTTSHAPRIKNIIKVYFFYLLLRVFFLNSLPVSTAVMKFRFYGPAVLLFFIGAYFSRNKALLMHIWQITVVIGCIAALYGFKQLTIGYSAAEELWFSNISFTTLFIKGLARPFSLFQSPAAFADYMQMSIIGVLVLFGATQSIYRYLFLPLIAMFFYSALITSVRSNWIGIILSLLIWVTVLALKKNSHRLITITTLCLFFFSLQIFGEGEFNGLESIFQTLGGGFNQQYVNLLITERTSALANPFEEYSFLSRMNLWNYIFRLSADPVMALLGRGVGVLNADSLYFTYLAEFGYPGFIFIIWFTVFVIRRGLVFSSREHDRTVTFIVRGITLMNIVLAVVNITGTHIHSFPGDVFYWFWNGVLIEITSSCTNSDTQHQLPDTPVLKTETPNITQPGYM